jgi:hypothetical protein
MCCTTPTTRAGCSPRRPGWRGGRSIIKDHIQEGWLDRQTLRLMDWTENSAYGAALPGNYWSAMEWTLALQ